MCDECGIEIPLVDVGPRRALLVDGELMMPSRGFVAIDGGPVIDADADAVAL